MNALRGITVAVTGATSGIGRSLALQLSQLGCGLALGDVDEAGLNETAAHLAPGDALHPRADRRRRPRRRLPVGRRRDRTTGSSASW